jgi:hypothetical protein
MSSRSILARPSPPTLSARRPGRRADLRAEVERALRRHLVAYAPQIEVDWSEGIGAAGPRGLAAITWRGDVLDAEDERLFDPRCDAWDAIMHAVEHCE